MEAVQDAAHQHVHAEQDVHLAEAGEDDALAVGQHRLAAVADLAAHDQFGQHGNMAAGEQMQRIAQDSPPEPADPDDAQHEPKDAEGAGNMSAKPGRATERHHHPHHAGNRVGQQDAEPGEGVGHGADQQAESGAQAMVPDRQAVAVTDRRRGPRTRFWYKTATWAGAWI